MQSVLVLGARLGAASSTGQNLKDYYDYSCCLA